MNKSILNIVFVSFSILNIIKYQYLFKYMQIFDVLMFTMYITILWILLQSRNLDKQSKKDIFDINSMQDLNYGICMAHNYYYGYLKLIIPSTGTLIKGLVEKIENIEDIHNISIASHKLFILIPSSSYIPPDLKEVSYNWMESAMNLESEIRNRAGVKARVYHNTVYKIYSNGERSKNAPVYLVIEGASPLQTFFDVQKYSKTNIYKKYCKDIIKQFYEKLNVLLNNDPEFKDLCELIYYDDYDNDGVRVNVAKVILNRLFEIQTKNCKEDLLEC